MKALTLPISMPRSSNWLWGVTDISHDTVEYFCSVNTSTMGSYISHFFAFVYEKLSYHMHIQKVNIWFIILFKEIHKTIERASKTSSASSLKTTHIRLNEYQTCKCLINTHFVWCSWNVIHPRSTVKRVALFQPPLPLAIQVQHIVCVWRV